MTERGVRNIRLEGVLRRGSTVVPIQVGYASRFSLYANVVGAATLPFHQEFDQVVVRSNKGEAVFGRCVFRPVEDGAGFTGRLVFSEDAYNFSNFFQDESHSSLESRSHKLALVLAQDKQIRPTFRGFVTDFLYELNAYKQFYDSLDLELEGEPADVVEQAQNTIIIREGPKFVELFDKGLEALQEHVRVLNREERASHGSYLRKQFWHLIMQSNFLARTNLRPRGYAGDSEMMRMIYANNYEGRSLLGKLLHKHPLDTSAAQAVRNRRALIANMLRHFRNDFTTQDRRMRVMSAACGPAYEVGDILHNREDVLAYDLTLLDQDVEALSEAARNMTQAELKHKTRAKVTYLNESVRTMLRSPQICDSWGKFDFVYSMGLFDYLTEPVARAVSRKLFDMLNPGGILLIGNYHVDNPTRLYMEYWMDWVLCYRTEAELLALFSDVPNAKASVGFEDTGSQMFLQVLKTS